MDDSKVNLNKAKQKYHRTRYTKGLGLLKPSISFNFSFLGAKRNKKTTTK